MINFNNKALKITGVGYQAFKDCTKLTDCNYKGTRAERPNVIKSSSWKSGSLFTVVNSLDGDFSV